MKQSSAYWKVCLFYEGKKTNIYRAAHIRTLSSVKDNQEDNQEETCLYPVYSYIAKQTSE